MEHRRMLLSWGLQWAFDWYCLINPGTQLTKWLCECSFHVHIVDRFVNFSQLLQKCNIFFSMLHALSWKTDFRHDLTSIATAAKEVGHYKGSVVTAACFFSWFCTEMKMQYPLKSLYSLCWPLNFYLVSKSRLGLASPKLQMWGPSQDTKRLLVVLWNFCYILRAVSAIVT